MARTVAIGRQDFEKMITRNNFYIDKTKFIREWWESEDDVTMIARPRRFGKTLNLSMVEQFFSVQYAGRGDLFEGLAIWEDEKYRKLQGTWPVIGLTFAPVKETGYEAAKVRLCQILTDLYNKNYFLLESGILTEEEAAYFRSVTPDMPETTAVMALHKLSDFLYRYYGKKVLILLDEYDTPMQEAYVSGYWEKMAAFTRNLFNAAFKTNPHMERALMTGITRVSRESVFSDLNNLEIITATSEKYEDCFGFTEEEVFEVLREYGLEGQKQEVKFWYDGFVFGRRRDIYNPWSIINYLDKKKIGMYWTNTSSNSLVGKLIQEGSPGIKQDFEALLRGETLKTEIDEQIVYGDLGYDEKAVWSLLLASGYLKAAGSQAYMTETGEWVQEYELELTNFEVKTMFRKMVRDWFGRASSDYHGFRKALLEDDLDAMNAYMNRIAAATFSFFDTGEHAEPERFYHGFVLGLLVDFEGRYVLTSNRESGYGRYDVLLEPGNPQDDAVILEFKVFQQSKEKSLEDTVQNALAQIESRNYAAGLYAKGIPEERIRKYGFAFQGKKVLIGKKESDC